MCWNNKIYFRELWRKLLHQDNSQFSINMVVLPSKSNEDEHHEENYGEHLEGKVFFCYRPQCTESHLSFSFQSFEIEISYRPVNHLKWDKSPQTKALSIQSQTQVENSFLFYCCVNVFLVMLRRPGKCRDRVQPPTGNDQFDLFINFCSRWNGSLL